MGASCPVHSQANSFILGVDVSFRGFHAGMTSQVRQRAWVHVGSPAREAGVPERIQRERLHAGFRKSQLLLCLAAGRFDVSAQRRGREHPFTLMLGQPPFDYGAYCGMARTRGVNLWSAPPKPSNGVRSYQKAHIGPYRSRSHDHPGSARYGSPLHPRRVAHTPLVLEQRRFDRSSSGTAKFA